MNHCKLYIPFTTTLLHILTGSSLQLCLSCEKGVKSLFIRLHVLNTRTRQCVCHSTNPNVQTPFNLRALVVGAAQCPNLRYFHFKAANLQVLHMLAQTHLSLYVQYTSLHRSILPLSLLLKFLVFACMCAVVGNVRQSANQPA